MLETESGSTRASDEENPKSMLKCDLVIEVLLDAT